MCVVVVPAPSSTTTVRSASVAGPVAAGSVLGAGLVSVGRGTEVTGLSGSDAAPPPGTVVTPSPDEHPARTAATAAATSSAVEVGTGRLAGWARTVGLLRRVGLGRG